MMLRDGKRIERRESGGGDAERDANPEPANLEEPQNNGSPVRNREEDPFRPTHTLRNSPPEEIVRRNDDNENRLEMPEERASPVHSNQASSIRPNRSDQAPSVRSDLSNPAPSVRSNRSVRADHPNQAPSVRSIHSSHSTHSRIEMAMKELEAIERVAQLEEEFERKQLERKKMLMQRRLELEIARFEESEGVRELNNSVSSRRTEERVDAMNSVHEIDHDGHEKSAVGTQLTAEENVPNRNIRIDPPPRLTAEENVPNRNIRIDPPPELSNVGIQNENAPWKPPQNASSNVNKQSNQNKPEIIVNRDNIRLYQDKPSENALNKQSRPVANVRNSENRDGNNEFKENPNVGDNVEMRKYIARQTIKRDLPQFNGKPEDWPSFIYDYNETTKSCQFSNSENLYRLRKALTGKAKESVESLLVSPENVPNIINKLTKRFGKPESIIEAHIAKVNKLAAPQEDKPETIIEFSDKISNLVVSMQVLKDERHMFNPHLVNAFVGKLPGSLKILWAQTLSSSRETANMKTFSDWLTNLSDTVNLLPTSAKKNPEVKSQSKDNPSMKKEDVFATQAEPVERPRSKCPLCEQDHYLDGCEEFKKLELDKRWDVAKEKKVCFQCLGKRHFKLKCPKKPCSIEGCKGRHHLLLHYEKKNAQTTTFTGFTQRVSTETLLRVCPITLINQRNGKRISSYALLDEASTTTLLDEKTADLLELEGLTVPLSMKWTNGQTHRELSKLVTLKIKGEDGNEFCVKGVRTVKNLDIPMRTVNARKIVQAWKELSKLELTELANVRPVILIGQDNIDLTIPREVIEFGQDQPIASRCKLGWTLHGPTDRGFFKGRVDEVHFHLCTLPDEDNQRREDERLHDLVKESFAIDAVVFKRESEKMEYSKDEQRALRIIEETARKTDKHWEIGLLWKDDNPNLPDNKEQAFERLKAMERKMDRDENFKKRYCEKINDYLEKGYAEKVKNPQDSPGRTWYLPHFGVINPNKPGKLRFVFDAAAKSRGVSLNNVLLKGLVLLNLLIDVLLRFREKKIAFIGDIREMFHQVKIRPEDRPAQRFLWRGEDRNKPPDVYEMSAMTFGGVSSPFCAQYLLIKNAKEQQEKFPHVLEAVEKNHYVDDYLGVADNVDEAAKLANDVIRVHDEGGFEIRGWTSNSKELLKRLPKNLLSDKVKEIVADKNSELPHERVLGLLWDPNEDRLRVSVKTEELKKEFLPGKPITKRKILSLVMSIFDPLGIVAPLTTKARIFLQDAWRSKAGWDEELPEETSKKWQEWINSFKETDFSVPRYVLSPRGTQSSIDLHTFVDASVKAYGAACYVRTSNDELTTVSFLMGKSRVAPLKPTTIPKLELQAAVLGTRLAQTVKNAMNLEFNSCYFWSDSQAVLGWIRTEEICELDVYVRNRVGEIHESSDPRYWRWVPTKLNVADDVTRCKTSVNWLQGPEFLLKSEDQWPKEPVKTLEKPNVTERTNVLLTEDAETEKKRFEILPDIKRFSLYLRLIRATAWILHLLRIFQAKRERRQFESELIPEEISAAEELWIKKSQAESFEEELQMLKKGLGVKKSSRIYNLNPILDEKGVIRIQGRLKYADLPESTKQPAIIDSKHEFTKMYLKRMHAESGHLGTEYVLNQARKRFWILKGRVTLKKIRLDCVICRKLKNRPVTPQMADLPGFRVTPTTRPFEETGMDYFGPITVTVGRRHEKRYGALFTCLATRAVHIEVTSSLNTDSALMAIRRFASRRGWPTTIHSDNGTNLMGAEKEINDAIKELDNRKITQWCTTKGTKWIFNPPGAPHMGGAWERLVKSVKTSLRVILKEQHPKDEVLQTLITEVEYTVNSRPLTTISEDPNDNIPLTPNDLLIGPGNHFESLGTGMLGVKNLKRQYEQSQKLAEQFWKRWLKEYLPTLNLRVKWRADNGKLGIKDVVAIADPSLPRNHWPLGKVVATYPGKDDKVRIVDVKTITGTYRRPVHKLVLLMPAREDVENE